MEILYGGPPFRLQPKASLHLGMAPLNTGAGKPCSKSLGVMVTSRWRLFLKSGMDQTQANNQRIFK